MTQSEAEDLRAELERAVEDVDYWYQVVQSLCICLVREHLPLNRVEHVLTEVTVDAAAGFESTLRPPLNLALASRLVQPLFEFHQHQLRIAKGE